MDVVVDIADMRISADPADRLVTYSLGSCMGVTVYDPVVHVGGMIHYMLPESALNPEKARSNPAMFADTGIPALFKAAYRLGAEKRRMIVRVAGGACMMDEQGTFNIGKRNYVMLRKLFWKNGVLIDAEDVGGALSRTLRLEIATGRTVLRTTGQERELCGTGAAAICATGGA